MILRLSSLTATQRSQMDIMRWLPCETTKAPKPRSINKQQTIIMNCRIYLQQNVQLILRKAKTFHYSQPILQQRRSKNLKTMVIIDENSLAEKSKIMCPNQDQTTNYHHEFPHLPTTKCSADSKEHFSLFSTNIPTKKE